MTPLPSGVPASAGGLVHTGGVARTVARKEACAPPPEFVAVTVIRSPSRSWSVAMVTTPVAESIVAPVPITANVSAAPAKAAAASTATGAAPASAATSASGATTVGAAWTIAHAAVSAAALPAALVAVTRAESARPSSAGCGT